MAQIICAQGSHRGGTQHKIIAIIILDCTTITPPAWLSWLVKVWEVPGSSPDLPV